jgi:hypothetical protein
MPYVDSNDRQNLGDGYTPENAGQLNYMLAQVVDQYIEDKGLSYQTLNDVAGVLNCLNLEIYRRITAPYENVKISANGDVFHKALALLKKAVGLA